MRKRKEERKHYKFCWEMGDGFHGFVFGFTGREAWNIANKILSLPVPKQVRKRLVYFCDASIRSLRGAAGIVWPDRYPSLKWQGKSIYYPLRTNDSATVELFAISCALRTAIEEIDEEHASVVANVPVDKEFFQSSMLRTESHLHSMSKEVFIFTDDINALRRIDGDLAYPPNGQMAGHVASISQYSRTLKRLGVHVELHLSPGHCKLPGNVAADAMAKRAQRQLVRETAISRPAEE
ncbi:Polynucleotidyl transferase, ribonuclease H fold [Penicillium camemberti]|uniref:Polynucleotidyl transferase, ribonuclease H fold n=1 Tax=Penicillium camemberti (strain FM 013) TaxID=1429867 RepID=A0A0G4PPG3_PENC3|nr:Polynucleotidyl transferase, ribonuclease H fold [Penicillium camemberti]